MVELTCTAFALGAALVAMFAIDAWIGEDI